MDVAAASRARALAVVDHDHVLAKDEDPAYRGAPRAFLWRVRASPASVLLRTSTSGLA
jgi:hypothetical protein